MATIVGKNSNAEKDPMQAALAEFRSRLSLAHVQDSLSASRYAVSSVTPGGAPTLTGAQVTPGTTGLPQRSIVFGTAPVSVTQAGAQFDVSLNPSGVTAGTYGDATHVGQFTVDSLGRVTVASNVSITGGAGGGHYAGTGLALETLYNILRLSVSGDPAINTTPLTIDTTAGSTAQVTVTGGTSPYNVTSPLLPSGLTMSAAGLITNDGTAATQTDTFVAVAKDAGGIQVASPLQIQVRGSGDPYWANVASLMYFNGTNGSTTFTDEVSGVTWTSSGGAQISTAQSKFGGSSLLIGATGILHTAAAIAALGAAYTIEGWVYVPNTAGGIFVENGSAWPNYFIQGSGGTQYSNGSGWIYSSGTTIAANTWTHIAISATDANHLYSFINGVLVGTGTTGSAAAYNLYIGQNSSGAQQCNGYIDCVRITAGIGRYTASFTPPTAPFPNHA